MSKRRIVEGGYAEHEHEHEQKGLISNVPQIGGKREEDIELKITTDVHYNVYPLSTSIAFTERSSSMKDMEEAFLYLYFAIPPPTSYQIRSYVPPKSILESLVNSDRCREDLKDLAKTWLKDEAGEKSPFRKQDKVENPRLVGSITQKVWENFIPKKSRQPVSLAMVQTSVKASVVGSILVILMDNFPFRTGINPVDDLYLALEFPENQSSFSDSAKWLYACVREALILPIFKSVDAFISIILRVLREAAGMAGLVTCSITRERASRICSEDHDFLDLVHFLYNVDCGYDTLDLSLMMFMDDNDMIPYLEQERPWSKEQEREANKIVRQYGPKPPDSPSYSESD